MITVNINGQAREDIDPSWIAQRVEGLRRDKQSVCVTVLVNAAGIDLRLAAGDCPQGSGGRLPSPQERELIDMWNDCAPTLGPAFPPGKLIECLKRLVRSL